MEIAPHINVDPKICSGSPVINGTRVHIWIIIGALASDMTEAEIMEEYVLTREQIKAALAYAANVIRGMDLEEASIETHLLESLESPATPMTQTDWDHIRHTVRQNLSNLQ